MGGRLGKSAGGSPEPAAGAGCQKPPRMLEAGVEGPPAVGALLPAMSERISPLYRNNGLVVVGG